MGGSVRFEYSPETFNITEPDFALRMSNRVAAVWDASPDRPVTFNLPTTVETDSPSFYADQIEWMHRNLDNRSSIILSVHPHNDRGTASRRALGRHDRRTGRRLIGARGDPRRWRRAPSA
jgi:2-isopropylmalate synthase